MTTLDAILWASRAISLFNTIALLWLGLTVLLNVERRRPGVWLAGGGLLLGGLFFAIHSAVVDRPLGSFIVELDLWWRVSWLPFVGLPFLWYLVMAWYTGNLSTRRHRLWVAGVAIWGTAAFLVLLVANPLTPLVEFARQPDSAGLAASSILAILVIGPVYSVACIALALAALRRPERSERFMGDLGRRRAIPWLLATSAVLFVIGLAVGGIIVWILHGVEAGRIDVLAPGPGTVLLGFDGLIAGLVGVAVVLMGRAIVSYEIFTGKTLPRQGLLRTWRSSLLIAAGYSAVVSASLSLGLDPTYQLLLVTVLLALILARISWRSYVEREKDMERLRPFVASPRLFDRIVNESSPAGGSRDLSPASPDYRTPTGAVESPLIADGDLSAPFYALCDDVLGARLAYLIAIGPLAPLVGPPIVFPASGPAAPAIISLADSFHSPSVLCQPVDPADFGGAAWAVTLWSERGLNGVMLLGEKRDGGLYTQEEIEIARVSGERLIDVRASAEMARRLMHLQRQRLAENQVLDRRTRHVLHDDVLPRLHAALLALSASPTGAPASVQDAVSLLSDVHQQLASLLRSLPVSAAPNVERLGLIEALRQEVEVEWSRVFDHVDWCIESGAGQVARAIPPIAAEVLFGAAREAIRNAARHGRGDEDSRPLHLTISVVERAGLRIEIEDDGIGLDTTTSWTAGTGQGMALHSTLLAVVGGTLDVDSVPNSHTRVTLALPI